jgi:hypothetical protein
MERHPRTYTQLNRYALRGDCVDRLAAAETIAIATAQRRNPWPRRHIAVRAAQPSLRGIWLCPVGDIEPLFGSLRFGPQGIGVVGLVGVS